MIGIVIAGHGIWPSALKKSLDMIYGEVPNLGICEVTDVESAEQIKVKMDEALNLMSDCKKYVFLLDIFGGSPCHAIVPYARRDDVLAITGANLAMLIELVTVRGEVEWTNLGSILLKTGREGIRDVLAELRQT